MSALMFALGLVIVLITAANVIFTLVLPRRPAGIERLSLVVNRSVRLVFLAISRFAETYEVKDAVLAPAAPVGPPGPAGGVAGLLRPRLRLHARAQHARVRGRLPAVRGDAVQRGHGARRGTVQPGRGHRRRCDLGPRGHAADRLPTLALRRLQPTRGAGGDAREPGRAPGLGPRGAGPPPAGGHHRHPARPLSPTGSGGPRTWPRAHTTYPVLLLFRSPEPWYSWVVGLLAVLDAAAMHLSLSPGRGVVAGPTVPAHGFHRLQPDRQDPRLARRSRPQPRGPDLADLRGVRDRPSRCSSRSGTPWSCPPRRRGRTSGGGGSTTRPPPTAWPTASSRPPPRGREPRTPSALGPWWRRVVPRNGARRPRCSPPTGPTPPRAADAHAAQHHATEERPVGRRAGVQASAGASSPGS